MRSVEIEYGSDILSLNLPGSAVGFVLEPHPTKAIEDPYGHILQALRDPVGGLRLESIAASAKDVVILVDDYTRPTPAGLLAGSLLDELDALGVPDQRVRILVASGSHRAMTQKEKIAKLGSNVLQRVEVLDHDDLDYESGLVLLGRGRAGFDYWVNRHAAQADVVIALGNIVPHYPTGWSGGAKMVLPGIAGRQTIGAFHLLGAEHPAFGRLQSVCRDEMNQCASQLGLRFIVNTVLNREGRIVHVAAGHAVDAHRAGVEQAVETLGVAFEARTPTTIATPYPFDSDLFQADKGLFSAAACTESGGEILLVSPLWEGLAPTHGEVASLAALSNEEIHAKLARGEVTDRCSAAEALYLNNIKQEFRVTLVTTGLSREETHRLGFGYVRPEDLEGAIVKRIAAGRGPIGIVRNAAEILPCCKE